MLARTERSSAIASTPSLKGRSGLHAISRNHSRSRTPSAYSVGAGGSLNLILLLREMTNVNALLLLYVSQPAVGR